MTPEPSKEALEVAKEIAPDGSPYRQERFAYIIDRHFAQREKELFNVINRISNMNDAATIRELAQETLNKYEK